MNDTAFGDGCRFDENLRYPTPTSGRRLDQLTHHDPLPPLDPLVTRYGEAVTIRYIQRDPGAIVIDFVKE